MKANEFRKTFVLEHASIGDAVQALEWSSLQIALIVDQHDRLLGTVTDGDIRRGLLKNLSLKDPVTLILHRNPQTADPSETREALLDCMRKSSVRHLPIVDADGKVVGLEILEGLLNTPVQDNPVLLMAGGLGTRLRPLTNETPKVLLKVDGRPILELIINNFISQGFQRFYVSVNYRAEMVMDYFGDGSRWGIRIEYLRETERLGTAGALALLPKSISRPFIVMNADLLTNINFSNLLSFHNEHEADATMCIRSYEMQLPYGVVETKGNRVVRISEKPTTSFFVNAGIYVLSPAVLSLLGPEKYLDMPCFLTELLSSNRQVISFPLREHWLDIGQPADFERASSYLERTQ